MKTFNFFFAFAMICVFPAQGQPFSSVALDNVRNSKVINFTLPRERNVRYYRVEASNDNYDYQIIGTVRSTGNSVLTKSYRYKLYEPGYKYYRVAMVGMDASLQYSAVISTINPTTPGEPAIKGPTILPGQPIVTNHKK